MKFKKILILTVILICVAPILAHEFWLQPQQYLFSAGDEVNIRFKVGEGFAGDNWKGNDERVQELKLYYADVTDNLKTALCSDEGDSVQFSLFEEGTAMVIFNSVNSYLELEAAKFNDYLLEDGLTSAIDYRKEHNETDSMSREFYQRSVKTIIQVGTKKTDVCKKQTSLPLDIIPLSHPYAISNNQLMKVKILFKGQPLANAKMRVWNKMPDAVTDTSYLSDAKGEISFPVTTSGEWMVSSVHMIHLDGDPKAVWQSYWGSLTWGYTGKSSTSSRSR
ncbi:MAG: DUF4198 domain-containing protein [Lacibacter sp.]